MEKAISEECAKELLKRPKRYTSGNGDDDYPYAVPVNYYLYDE